jgi:methyl-accepting chemotaxis protein
MAGKSHPVRHIYVVDWSFQLKYTSMLVVFGGLIMGGFGAAVIRELRTNSELLEGKRIEAGLSGATGKLPSLGDFQSALSSTDHRQVLIVVGASVIVAAFLGLVGVLVTHRVAGPIFVLSRYAKALGDGGFPRMRALRRGDELKGYFEVFREAIEKLRERQAAEAAQLEELANRSTGQVASELRALASVKQQSLSAAAPSPQPK